AARGSLRDRNPLIVPADRGRREVRKLLQNVTAVSNRVDVCKETEQQRLISWDIDLPCDSARVASRLVGEVSPICADRDRFERPQGLLVFAFREQPLDDDGERAKECVTRGHRAGERLQSERGRCILERGQVELLRLAEQSAAVLPTAQAPAQVRRLPEPQPTDTRVRREGGAPFERG